MNSLLFCLGVVRYNNYDNRGEILVKVTPVMI